jgi:hypothetical protein
MIEQPLGAGIGEDEADLLDIQQQIHRHHHRPGLDDPQVGDGEGVRVGAIEGHPIAPFDPPRRQGAGQGIGGGVHLGEGHVPIRQQDGRLRTQSGRRLAQQVGDGLREIVNGAHGHLLVSFGS